MPGKSYNVILLAFVLAVCAPLSHAENQITIQDTAGFTRAVAEVGVSGRVEFALTDEHSKPADAIEVTLTNTASGETLTAKSVNGVVTFENVAPGVWTVSTPVSGITFTNVALLADSTRLLAGQLATQFAAQYGPAMLGVGAASVGTIALVDSLSDDDDEKPLSPAS